MAVCYLWGFAGAASWVGAALAVVMGDGPTIRGRDFVAAPAVGGVFLARSRASHAPGEAAGQ